MQMQNKEMFDFEEAILRATQGKIVTNFIRQLCGFYLNPGEEIFFRNVRDPVLTFPISFADVHVKSWRELDNLDEIK